MSIMIQNEEIMKKNDYISDDNKFYKTYSLKTRLQLIIRNDHWIAINRYLKYLRLEEFYFNQSGIVNKVLSYFWSRKKNILGNKLGFYIPPNTLGIGATIYHHGCIIINGDSKIGNNCVLHGMNCIGNNGLDTRSPIIGNNVDIGIGAKVIGGITVADNVTIGANAVVTKSCLQKGAVLVGVPAKVVKIKEYN